MVLLAIEYNTRITHFIARFVVLVPMFDVQIFQLFHSTFFKFSDLIVKLQLPTSVEMLNAFLLSMLQMLSRHTRARKSRTQLKCVTISSLRQL